MQRKQTIGKQASRLAATLAALAALLAASAAGAGLPKVGDWIYDIPTGTVFGRSERHPTSFRAYVEFSGNGTGFVYAFDAIVGDGTCTKNGRRIKKPVGGATRSDGPDTPGHLAIPIRRDGHFSGRANVIDDKEAATVKGQINGTKLTGTVKLHVRNAVWGDCQGTGKIVHIKGVRVA